MTEKMKLQRELNSLWGLTIINIAFGGLAMAFAITIITQNIFPMVNAKNILFPQIVFTAIGFFVAAISIKWLVSSAEMLSGADSLKEDYAKEKQSLDEDGLAGLILKMMVYYRENKPAIKSMMILSRIAGICFSIAGTFSLATILTGAITGVPQVDLLASILGTGIIFATAVASFAIPHFFGKYSRIWDHRLQEIAKAEEKFKKQIQEDQR